MKFLVRRTATLLVTLFLISAIIFSVFQIIPGDPAQIILGMDADEQRLAALRAEFNLDQPLYQRYFLWLQSVVTGDLGMSIRFEQPVQQLLISRLPVTFFLAFFSMLLVLILAVPLGILAAKAHQGFFDFVISITTQLGMAIPSFWLGILLMMLFSVTLRLFIPGGYVSFSENPWGFVYSLSLPAFAIALPQIAVVIRYLRGAILEELKMDYVRTAKSKGLKERKIIYRHVLKNALIPVLTVLGLIIARILAGSIVLEQVFSLPGVGRLLITSISFRDFPLISGLTMYIAVMVTFINFIVDLLYLYIDPRIRLE